jgi:hypothetical protein
MYFSGGLERFFVVIDNKCVAFIFGCGWLDISKHLGSGQGRREGGRGGNFYRGRTSKGAKESEIYLFLSHILKFYRGPGKIHHSLYGLGSGAHFG